MTQQQPGRTGLLIINADDWGRDRETTDRTLECIVQGAVSSVSAMVFMQDSARAADMAVQRGINAGLHLNLTTPFSASASPPALSAHLAQVAHHLLRHRVSPIVFHTGLMHSFEYLVAAQREEYHRLYGAEPARIDGHHHMHLCANVLFGKLLPAGVIARRSFSFGFWEKNLLNVAYRRVVDKVLAARHRLADYLFSLRPLDAGRLRRIFALAQTSIVEVETHPVNGDEHRFLTEGDLFRLTGEIPVARGYWVG